MENEVCLYAKVNKPEGLLQAQSVESHIQFEFKIPGEEGENKRRIRVRKTRPKMITADHGITEVRSLAQCTETFKVDHPVKEGMLSCDEHTTAIEPEYFNAWIAHFGMNGVAKMRYVFLSKDVAMVFGGKEIVLPDVKYEVDIFYAPDGSRSKYCKIDVEVDPIIAYLKEHHPDVQNVGMQVKISHLPFDPVDPILASSNDPAVQKMIDAFWAKFSITAKDVDHVGI